MPVWLEDERGLVRRIMPDAGYVFGAATKDVLAIGGALAWSTVKRKCGRSEIGADAVLGESDAVKVDPGWAVSARLGVRWRMSDWISAVAWAGAVQTGRINTNEGYFLPKLMLDYGVGVAVGL